MKRNCLCVNGLNWLTAPLWTSGGWWCIRPPSRTPGPTSASGRGRGGRGGRPLGWIALPFPPALDPRYGSHPPRPRSGFDPVARTPAPRRISPATRRAGNLTPPGQERGGGGRPGAWKRSRKQGRSVEIAGLRRGRQRGAVTARPSAGPGRDEESAARSRHSRRSTRRAGSAQISARGRVGYWFTTARLSLALCS